MLRNKQILITAGPTWVKIDKVRVISNISSGKVGSLIAKAALKQGAKVTVLLGPVFNRLYGKPVKIIRYCFFDELVEEAVRLLKTGKFDAIIHAAAVSDYEPKNKINYKIKSGIKNFDLKLVPTVNLINKIKKIAPRIFLVGFKLEATTDKLKLINASQKLFRQARADLVVANSLDNLGYRAMILDRQKNILARANSRKELALKLIKQLKVRL